MQGRLGRNLAVTHEGQVAVINSSFEQGKASRIVLIRGSPTSRFSLGSG
jgi:hypothetical protein